MDVNVELCEAYDSYNDDCNGSDDESSSDDNVISEEEDDCDYRRAMPIIGNALTAEVRELDTKNFN